MVAYVDRVKPHVTFISNKNLNIFFYIISTSGREKKYCKLYKFRSNVSLKDLYLKNIFLVSILSVYSSLWKSNSMYTNSVKYQYLHLKKKFMWGKMSGTVYQLYQSNIEILILGPFSWIGKNGITTNHQDIYLKQKENIKEL